MLKCVEHTSPTFFVIAVQAVGIGPGKAVGLGLGPGKAVGLGLGPGKAVGIGLGLALDLAAVVVAKAPVLGLGLAGSMMATLALRALKILKVAICFQRCH